MTTPLSTPDRAPLHHVASAFHEGQYSRAAAREPSRASASPHESQRLGPPLQAFSEGGDGNEFAQHIDIAKGLQKSHQDRGDIVDMHTHKASFQRLFLEDATWKIHHIPQMQTFLLQVLENLMEIEVVIKGSVEGHFMDTCFLKFKEVHSASSVGKTPICDNEVTRLGKHP